MTEIALSEVLYIRFPPGARAQIQKAARARARRIGITATLPMAEFIRMAVAKAIKDEKQKE